MSTYSERSLNSALHARFMTPGYRESDPNIDDVVILDYLEADPEATLKTISGIESWAKEHGCVTEAGKRVVSKLVRSCYE